MEEHDIWGLKLNLKKTKYMAIGDTARNLELEDRKGITEHVKEYKYIGATITNERDVSHIHARISKRRAVIIKLNSVLRDRNLIYCT